MTDWLNKYSVINTCEKVQHRIIHVVQGSRLNLSIKITLQRLKYVLFSPHQIVEIFGNLYLKVASRFRRLNTAIMRSLVILQSLLKLQLVINQTSTDIKRKKKEKKDINYIKYAQRIYNINNFCLVFCILNVRLA